jgi:hypothetical protein
VVAAPVVVRRRHDGKDRRVAVDVDGCPEGVGDLAAEEVGERLQLLDDAGDGGGGVDACGRSLRLGLLSGQARGPDLLQLALGSSGGDVAPGGDGLAHLDEQPALDVALGRQRGGDVVAVELVAGVVQLPTQGQPVAVVPAALFELGQVALPLGDVRKQGLPPLAADGG